MFRALPLTFRGPRAVKLAYNSTQAFIPKEYPIPLAPRPSRAKSLAGTVPHHTSYLLLHALQSPAKWPSIFLSPLYFELQKKIKDYGGLVNFCWGRRDPEIIHAALGRNDTEEMYGATFWTVSRRGGLALRVDIPLISRNNSDEVLSELFSGNLKQGDKDATGPYFYVCTHAQRDCRCGVRGGEFAEALRKELQDRGISVDNAGNSRVGELGHVGGHKNAPNVIVFPQGDWYGNLEPSDIPALLDYWIPSSQRSGISGPVLLDGPNSLQWRGRMGMTREAQALTVVDRT